MSTPTDQSVPGPNTSNTVLFEMILWYRSQIEAASSELRTLRDRVDAQQHEINSLRQDNQDLTRANTRGANLVMMKHEAGRIFGECTDRFADLAGTMRREIPEVAPFCPEIERILLRADFAHHMLHGINYVDLTADEDIETEVDSEGEEL